MKNNMLNAAKPQSTKDVLLNKYTSARSNLLLAIVFTVVNTALLLGKSTTYFLFSLFVPYQIVVDGMYATGNLPDEFYGDKSQYIFKDESLLYITLAIAAVIVLVFILCWLLSKNGKATWLIVALVLFVIDTVLMFVANGTSTDYIVDIVFHFWVLASLASGIKAFYSLRDLPVEKSMETVVEAVEPVAEETVVAAETAVTEENIEE